MFVEVTKIILLLLIIIILFTFFPLAFGAPFQSSSNKRTKIILKFAKIKKGEKVADLGSGNGKLVIAMAKQGAEAHGYEVNPILVWWSRRKIKKLGLEKKAFIHKENFWNSNLKKFDVITIFQIMYVMKKLAKKLEKNSKKEARIISNTWKFHGKKLIKQENGVYLYKF